MSDEKPVTASHPQVQPGIGGDTSIRINVKHVLIILGTVSTMGWGLAKYFYEQTHKNIDEVQDEVKELRQKLEEMDKRVDGHDVKISALEAKENAADLFADATGVPHPKVEEIIGLRPNHHHRVRVKGGLTGLNNPNIRDPITTSPGAGAPATA